MTHVELLVKDRFRFVWRLANGVFALASVEDVRAGGTLLEVRSAQELWTEGEAEGESREALRASRDDAWAYDIVAVNDASIVVEARHCALPLRAELRIRVDEGLPGIRKSASVAWEGSGSFTLVRMGLGTYVLAEPAQGGGKGQPALASSAYLGVDHPCGYAESSDGAVSLYHWPGIVLNGGPGGGASHARDAEAQNPEASLSKASTSNESTSKARTSETWTSKEAVIGVCEQGASPVETLRAYVLKTAKHQGGFFSVYGDWADHDELGKPDVQLQLTEEQTLANVALLEEQAKSAGRAFDYYLIDHGWYDTAGDLTQLAWPNWPSGSFDEVRKRLEAIGTRLGLWFAVNLARSGGWKLPVGLAFNRSLDDSRCGDTEKAYYCLSHGSYPGLFERALLYWARRGIKLMKFDFATFRCRHSGHAGLPEPCAEEQDVDAFLGILERVLEEAPDVKFVVYNGFPISPWWFRRVDTAYVGDVQPSPVPTAHLRASTILFDCLRLIEFERRHCPRPLLDDCGVMFGLTTTIFQLGLEGMRAAALVNLGRGILAHWYYGRIKDFAPSDWSFVWKVLRLAEEAQEHLRDPVIVGTLDGAAPYGYVHPKADLAVVYNPTVKRFAFTLSVDSASAGTASADPASAGPATDKVTFTVSPAGADSPGKSAFSASSPHGSRAEEPGRVTGELAPYEARLVRISSGETVLSSLGSDLRLSAERDRLPAIRDGMDLPCFDLEGAANERRVRVDLEPWDRAGRPPGTQVVVYFRLYARRAEGEAPVPWHPPQKEWFDFTAVTGAGDVLSYTPVPKRPAWSRPAWVGCIVALPSSEWARGDSGPGDAGAGGASRWLDVTLTWPEGEAPDLVVRTNAQAFWP